METEEIKRIVLEIKNSKIKDKENYFGDLYPEFKQKYPLLYKMACENKDLTHLDFMLTMLDKIKNNEDTQFDASAKVGQMLYQNYVEPTLKK